MTSDEVEVMASLKRCDCKGGTVEARQEQPFVARTSQFDAVSSMRECKHVHL